MQELVCPACKRTDFDNWVELTIHTKTTHPDWPSDLDMSEASDEDDHELEYLERLCL